MKHVLGVGNQEGPRPRNLPNQFNMLNFCLQQHQHDLVVDGVGRKAVVAAMERPNLFRHNMVVVRLQHAIELDPTLLRRCVVTHSWPLAPTTKHAERGTCPLVAAQ